MRTEQKTKMSLWPRFGSALSAALLAAGCAALPGSAPADGRAALPRGAVALFDGGSLEGWQQVGPGRFTLQPDGSLLTEGGMGLLYYNRPFRDFVLELDYRTDSRGANSGIFVRFPERPADPMDAVRGGYEIQIDDNARDPQHVTGAIYGVAAPSEVASRPAGEWNHYRIEVTGQRYRVYLNGVKVNDFFGTRAQQGYVGLQNHDPDSRVYFRNVRVTPLRVPNAPQSLADLFTTRERREPVRVLMMTATTGWRHGDAIEAAREVTEDLERTTELQFDATEDVSVLTPENLAKYDVLLFANSTLRVAEPDDTTSRQPTDENRNHQNPAPKLTKAQEQAVLDFVRSGKGVALVHSAMDALYGSAGYREMVGGGLFESHPWTQHVRVDVEDPTNPAVRHLGTGFGIRDEIYVLDRNPRWNSRVLLSLDMPSVGVETGSAAPDRDDYPLSWARRYGQGRVFATVLGHFPDVWRSPAFAQHLVEGLRIAAGRTEADLSGHRVKETIAKDVWPDDLVADEQGNVWIAELTGRILRYDGATKQTATVATIPTTDPMNIEHGVLGIEIDPNFYRGEPYLYVFYTRPEVFVNTLSRFTYRDGKIDLSSEKVLLRVPTEPACCHQAGDLEWGPNQTLFVSTGDTGQSGTKPDQEIPESRIQAFVERNELTDYHWSRLVDSERTSQNLAELRGKILRVNKDGTIPKDNPFYGKPGVRWEIYAYGLRNPYRFKYDRETGRLFIGVVGPDEQTTYDEYNVSRRGGENFGWPRDAGRLLYNEWTPEMTPAWTAPVWEYTYATGGRSASGGPVYRSRGKHAFPQLQGKALVYDWSRKWLKYGDVVNGTFASDTTGDVRADERQFTRNATRMANIKTFDVLQGTSPISMDVGPDGCIYVAEFTGFWRPAPGANVSRYCWVQDSPPAAAGAPASTAGPSPTGSR
jgi:cytochrome c